jgi:hypothetical protein
VYKRQVFLGHSSIDPVVPIFARVQAGADGEYGWLFQNTADVDKQYTLLGGHGAYWTDYSTLGIIGGQLGYQ